MKKNNNPNYVFIPRSRETIRRIIDHCSQENSWTPINEDMLKAQKHKQFEATSLIWNGRCNKKTTQRVTIYRDDEKKNLPGKVHFIGQPNGGAYYKKLDLKEDQEHVEYDNSATPTFAELNFQYGTAGSDEVGNGDIFKPIIVTAAYVTPEDMDFLLEWNVRDSKEISSKIQMREIGEALTGISDFSEVQEGAVVKAEHVTYCTYILSNEDYNQSEQKGLENKNDKMRQLHAKALNAVTKSCNPDYLLIDDFMDGDYLRHIEFKKMLEAKEEQVFLRQKADSLNMAVSCASVISSYFGNLYLEQLKYTAKE